MSTNRDRFFMAIHAFNQSDLATYLTLYDESLQLHGYSETPMSKAEAADFYAGMLASVSDAKIEVHQVIEDEAGHLVARFTLTGVHTGEFAGVPGTGNPISQDGMTILKFRNGHVVERWSIADTLSVLLQIGAISLD